MSSPKISAENDEERKTVTDVRTRVRWMIGQDKLISYGPAYIADTRRA